MSCCGSRSEQVELISIFFSPWSLKVKWALTASGVVFVNTEKPFLEWPLRVRLGIYSDDGVDDTSDGKLTYPMLVKDDGTIIRQTLDIVKWSHGRGMGGQGLGGRNRAVWNFEIDLWDSKSVQLMRFGRRIGLSVANSDDKKCVKMVRLLGIPLPSDALKLKVGRAANGQLMSKYAEESETTSMEETMSILDELQHHLRAQSSRYIVECTFSYADVCMVIGLHCISPFKDDIPMGMLAPILGVDLEDVASRYGYLFAWGKEIIDKHFPTEMREEKLPI
eukprot:TRINITY_DN19798_c0_g1_i1.p1 TRINITY_DN19798_c0_g1~~TRINITY_DN19798_c0_g1_i1.p1  ORF type:complete len:278 (-),score=46.96 TRINITY_DN19798_c0_g1_i1:63-896(-)